MSLRKTKKESMPKLESEEEEDESSKETGSSGGNQESEDGHPGIWSEEARLYLQDSRFSKETSEDLEEGKKLPEKAKEEVDSKVGRVVVEVIRIFMH